MPVLGTLSHFVPEQELVLVRRLDLAEDLYLHDHLFVHAPCKPVGECMPVLPLTMSLEFLAEVGALLAPGRGLIGFEEIRGHRWIGLRSPDPMDLHIEARVASVEEGTGVVRVRGEFFTEDGLSFSGTALLGESYRQDLDWAIADSGADGPWPFAAEDVYGQRLMFHGPAFYTVAGLSAFGNPAASLTLRAMPRDRLFASHPDPLLLTDPCLMDGIGQALGLWARAFNHYILPVSIGRIEFYAPPPPVGTPVPLRLEVQQLDLDARQIRSNFELEDGRGQVWARVAGWSDWLLKWTDTYDAAQRLPTQAVLSEELELAGLPEASVCTLVRREDVTGVDLDWMAGLFLHSGEMSEYAVLDDKQRRREMVWGRAAAKDAVRLWVMRNEGAELRHPAEFCLQHDALGRPFLPADGDRPLPHVSVAHTREGAVALAADVPVGIDVESASRDVAGILEQFATAAEAALLQESADAGEAWEVRLWCAKEALGKRIGTGLQGRPKDFEAIAVDEGGDFLMLHHPTGERFVVHTARVDGVIVAYTAQSAPGGTAAADSQWSEEHVAR
jgi:phosphopantetheinyl transferase